MTEADIQCLKDNIDKPVEIQTLDGECLVARVLFVTHNDEFDEHDVLYEVLSSNKINSYAHMDTTGGYVLEFDKIVSVKPVPSKD
jgi:hypothetical protein